MGGSQSISIKDPELPSIRLVLASDSIAVSYTSAAMLLSCALGPLSTSSFYPTARRQSLYRLSYPGPCRTMGGSQSISIKDPELHVAKHSFSSCIRQYCCIVHISGHVAELCTWSTLDLIILSHALCAPTYCPQTPGVC